LDTELNTAQKQTLFGWCEDKKPVPVAARSEAWVCDRSFVGTRGSDPLEAWMSVSFKCCVSSGRGLWVGLITRPEESYRVWRV